MFCQFLLNLLFLCLFLFFFVSSTLPNSIDAMVQKHSFDSHSFKLSSFTNSASQLSFCCSKFSDPKNPTTRKSSISVSPTNPNNFSSSIPYVIKSNDSKFACAPPKTSHILPFSIKCSRRLFSLLLKPANQLFLKIRSSLFCLLILSF